MAVTVNAKTVGDVNDAGVLEVIDTQKNVANGVAGLDSTGKLNAFGATTQVQFNNAGVFAGSANLTYTETGSLAGGPELTVGSNGGTNTGWIWGSYASGTSGMWSTAVTPSTTNYALYSTGAITILNGVSTLLFNIGNSATAFMNNAQFQLNTPTIFGWTVSGGAGGALDTAFSRKSAGRIQVNTGTADSFADLEVRQHFVDQTITAAGTTGAQTINKAAGTVNFAAAATSLVVTNSLVTANSTVHCTIRTNDATARLINVVPAAGSFTINLVATTAETSVGFLVVN